MNYISGIPYGHVKIKLRDIMHEKNINRSQLSKAIETRIEVINRLYFEESIRVDLDILSRLCFALDCSINDIVEYEKHLIEK